jgi:hypothetical protein
MKTPKMNHQDTKAPRKAFQKLRQKDEKFFLNKNLSLVVLGALVSWWFTGGCSWASDSSFRVEAPLTVGQPGLVEMALPPGLHILSPKGLDLRVMGPEGQSRPFELYWREEKSEYIQGLPEKTVQLLPDGRFRWEGRLEKPLKVHKIQVYLSAGDYVGKVDVFGLQGKNWKTLAQNAALYQVEGKSWAEVPIPEGTYQDLRLEFASFDQKYRQKLVPIDRVEATSEKPGKDYAEQTLTLVPQRVDGKDEIQLSASLPGSGLWAKELDLATSEPFLGDWTLGLEQIVGGKKQFIAWRQGHVESLGKGSSTLKIEINGLINGKTLLLRLHPKNYLGPVKKWEVVVRLPRLVFKADKGGTYRIQAGAGEGIPILDVPSAENRGIEQTAACGPVQANPDWKPENLVMKYHLGGGPFEGEGYAWQAPISLSGPGFYRLVLNQRASLEGHTEGLRVAWQGQQVPYFLTSGESREVVLAVTENYDRDKNKSTWLVELPQASPNWGDLLLQTQGIFSRTVVLEKQNSNSMVWEPWRREAWASREDKVSEIRVPLSDLPEGVAKVRVTIDHGDNRPISLKKVSVFYDAPALCFLAEGSDGYSLAGGNPMAAAPQYDLGLVENDLLSQEPQIARMGEVQPYSGLGFKFRLFRIFVDTRWGLYAVLGLVTAAMLFLIGRLFPAISNSGSRKNNF